MKTSTLQAHGFSPYGKEKCTDELWEDLVSVRSGMGDLLLSQVMLMEHFSSKAVNLFVHFTLSQQIQWDLILNMSRHGL